MYLEKSSTFHMNVVRRLHKGYIIHVIVYFQASLSSSHCDKLDKLAWKYTQSKNIRIYHEFVDRIHKSVPRVTAWHHEALPSDAKQ